jgi:hypothetical protein
MNVVTRSLMAAGLVVYAAIQALQVINPPSEPVLWLQVAFTVTVGVALVLAGGLIVREPGNNQPWKDLAAFVAAGSAIAMLVLEALGLPGVEPMDVRTEAWTILGAEAIILVSWFADRSLGHRYDEVEA